MSAIERSKWSSARRKEIKEAPGKLEAVLNGPELGCGGLGRRGSGHFKYKPSKVLSPKHSILRRYKDGISRE